MRQHFESATQERMMFDAQLKFDSSAGAMIRSTMSEPILTNMDRAVAEVTDDD